MTVCINVHTFVCKCRVVRYQRADDQETSLCGRKIFKNNSNCDTLFVFMYVHTYYTCVCIREQRCSLCVNALFIDRERSHLLFYGVLLQ